MTTEEYKMWNEEEVFGYTHVPGQVPSNLIF